MSNPSVPSYLECAKPNPAANRAPWYKNTAPTYAGIFLWFVFWSYSLTSGTPGGMLSAGVGVALGSVLAAALLCHFAFYYLPARFGQKTGLPLYIVGSSTFGATGGFLLPGFLMGLLQFGWLAVNIFGSSMAMNQMFGFTGFPLYVVMAIWGIAAVVAALKGIQYVAKFSTYLPLVPVVILIVLVAKTLGGLGSFDASALVAASTVKTAGTGASALSAFGVFAFALTYIVGFFATAGAAGVDFGTGSRNKNDVSMGGLVGVALAIFLTIGAAILITAGFYGSAAGKAALASGAVEMNPMNLMGKILQNDNLAKWLAFALAITAFPSACFSSLIAANSIKTTLPKVNPWISCGIGCVISIALAISGVAGKCIAVFAFIGASFGPICGAITMEYILSKGRWSGPRAAFNPAGWVSWAIGFAIGVQPNFAAQCGFAIPAAPVVAFIAGALVYALLAKAQSAVLPYPQADQQSAE